MGRFWRKTVKVSTWIPTKVVKVARRAIFLALNRIPRNARNDGGLVANGWRPAIASSGEVRGYAEDAAARGKYAPSKAPRGEGALDEEVCVRVRRERAERLGSAQRADANFEFAGKTVKVAG